MNLYKIIQNTDRVGEGMTHFERLFVQKVGGGKINEISGVPPLRYKGYGEPLTDYIVSGNAIQNGTPAPNYPLNAVGSGVWDETQQSYKLPITVNGVEYPIYIGTAQTTRKTRKLVLRGQETFEYQPAYSRYILTVQNAFADGIRQTPCFCSHYQSVHNGEPIDDVPNLSIYINQSADGSQFCIKDQGITELVVFKAFLANQYTAGKPVTIWYILDTPENVIVNEPLMKIGDYADTVSFAQAGVSIPTIKGQNVLDIPTQVPPSNVWIQGKIKGV